MIGAALRRLLLDSSVITDAISQRIYWQVLKQDSQLPAIVYQEIDTRHEQSHSPKSSGMAEARFQFDVYANTSVLSSQVSEKIRITLQGFHGKVSFDPDNVVMIFAIFPDGDRYLPADDKTGQFRRSSDYLVHYREPIPS